MKKRPVLLIGVVFALAFASVVCCALLYVRSYGFLGGPKPRKFNAAVWHATSPGQQPGMPSPPLSPRMAMVEDLMKHRMKRGMTRAATRALLGDPDYGSMVDDMNRVDRYYLGPENDTDIDPNSLALTFSDKGRLESVVMN